MITVLIVIAVGYACLCALVHFGQAQIIFPGGQFSNRTPSMPPFKWQYEDLHLDVGAEKTHAWFMPVENARGVVLFSHGNGGALPDWIDAVIPFRDLGFSVLLYDYGGYGTSTGRASEQRCYADVRAMWKYLTETRGIAPGKILLFGRSLGGGVTAQLASETAPGAVILESTFTSISALAQEKVPVFPMRLLIWNRFNSISKVSQIHAPLMVVHSTEDTLIPFHHGRALFNGANEPKRFLEIRGDHNDGVIVSEHAYREGLRAFSAEYFK